jgi:hypothetical protein
MYKMATKLHTFMDIFDSVFQVEGQDPVKLAKITIPKIQRDYAQGRKSSEIKRVRERFLDSLHEAITKKPITLDFVYGDIKDGVMIPLDGQQRLTTLFLIHWYAAKKEHIPPEEYLFLKNFSYETRYSARDFCTEMLKYEPSFEKKISEEIINQGWFPLNWKKDPTISSMLVMIDAIDEKFRDTPNIWERLKNEAITFYFLPIKDMGLTDELYIRMNSRGKPLTQFEHFKAEFERELRLIDEAMAKRIIRKIDLDWTDLLWQYHKNHIDNNTDKITGNNTIDDEFLRYFKFVCDVICYHTGGTPQGRSYDEFDLLKMYFSKQCDKSRENAETLERYFDCWCSLNSKTPGYFIARFISYEHEPGKIQIDKSYYQIDIFKDCLDNYADSTGRRRTFPLNRIVLLYAFTSFLLNRDSITENQFARRLRMINNLVQNSEDEISDSKARASGNRMPSILAQVDKIITSGYIDNSIDNNFSIVQLAEEKEKLIWTEKNPDKEESLFELEDHTLLQGQIAILGLENEALFKRFKALFDCSWDKVDCALMAIGFYPQKEKNGWRFQFGSSNPNSWRNLFHKSGNYGFDNTKKILVELLSKDGDIGDELLDQIAAAYLKECEDKNEYDWRYYYIKYEQFRPGSYGKYSNSKYAEARYLFSVMQTQSKWSENTYMPYLKIADEAHLSRDSMGQKLKYENAYIECENATYLIKKNVTGEELERISINQNEDGIDTEDRIMKLKDYLVSNHDILQSV